jgi:hypothetical protein
LERVYRIAPAARKALFSFLQRFGPYSDKPVYQDSAGLSLRWMRRCYSLLQLRRALLGHNRRTIRSHIRGSVPAVNRHCICDCLTFLLHDDGSPGLGILWFMVFLIEATLIIPLSLAATAELIERKVQKRPFGWSHVFTRLLMALPIAVGPLYAVMGVHLYVESHRPAHWLIKEIVLYFLSGVFAYFALRIRKQQPLNNGDEPPQPIVGQVL